MASLIETVIRSEYPDWQYDGRNTSEWMSVLCPFHGDTRPSAGLSIDNDAFVCHSCGVKGDAIGLIMKIKGVSRKQAIEIAVGLSDGGHEAVQRQPAKQPRRRAFGEAGTRVSKEAVRTGIRQRSTPWS